MSKIERRDIERMVGRTMKISPSRRSIWHNMIVTLWEHVAYLESRGTKHDGGPSA